MDDLVFELPLCSSKTYAALGATRQSDLYLLPYTQGMQVLSRDILIGHDQHTVHSMVLLK